MHAMSAPRSHRVTTTSRAPSGPRDNTPSNCQTRRSQNCPGATFLATKRNDSSACDQLVTLRSALTS